VWVKRYILVCIAFVIFLILLPSCGGNKKSKHTVLASSAIDSYDVESVYKEQSFKEAAFSAIRRCIDSTESDDEHLIKKLEAHLVDIPIPVNTCPLEQYFVQTVNGNVCIAYDSNSMQLEEVFAFYQREMERFGWQRMAQLEGHETVLVYKKPKKICLISLRQIVKRPRAARIVITQMHID